MTPLTYYNEHDKAKAATLRELIDIGAIAPGEVDERSIVDVGLDDLRGFTQCHFFAGGGVWSYALRLAGWPDDRPVWTGSCPCPGFSAAGKGGGFRDARHLWPDWFRLIRECRPANIFGEQVDDAIGYGWLDLVQTDLEAADYAVGKAVFGACSVGAPHIRQRLYFGAVSNSDGLHLRPGRPLEAEAVEQGSIQRSPDAEHPERRTQRLDRQDGRNGANAGRPQAHGEPRTRGEVCGSADTQLPERRPEYQEHAASHGRDGLGWSGAAGGRDSERDGRGPRRPERERFIGQAASEHGSANDERGIALGARLQERSGNGRVSRQAGQPDAREAAVGATAGFWSDAIWLPCTDGKYRPTQPGLFPLVNGTSCGVVHRSDPGITEDEANHTTEARVHRLRLYGDAIVAQQAQAFIEAFA